MVEGDLKMSKVQSETEKFSILKSREGTVGGAVSNFKFQTFIWNASNVYVILKPTVSALMVTAFDSKVLIFNNFFKLEISKRNKIADREVKSFFSPSLFKIKSHCRTV